MLLVIGMTGYANAGEKVVEVLSPQIIYLNSATKLNGMTRQVLSFSLPPNTVKWYYSFSAYRNKDETDRVQQKFNLFSKLSYLVDQTGASAALISMVSSPPGGDHCDVILLDEGYDEVFKYGTSLTGGAYYYNKLASRFGLVSGVVEVNTVKPVAELGIKNPDMLYGIYVSIQVVAIVNEPQLLNGWNKDQKEWMYSSIKELIVKNAAGSGISEDQINQFAGCITRKMIKTYKPEDFEGLASYEVNEMAAAILKQCAEELNIPVF